MQVYLAGRGAFGASTYSAHKDFGNVLHFVPGVILILTVVSRTTRNRVDVILAILLIVLPVNALLLLGVASALLARDLHVVRA